MAFTSTDDTHRQIIEEASAGLGLRYSGCGSSAGNGPQLKRLLPEVSLLSVQLCFTPGVLLSVGCLLGDDPACDWVWLLNSKQSFAGSCFGNSAPASTSMRRAFARWIDVMHWVNYSTADRYMVLPMWTQGLSPSTSEVGACSSNGVASPEVECIDRAGPSTCTAAGAADVCNTSSIGISPHQQSAVLIGTMTVGLQRGLNMDLDRQQRLEEQLVKLSQQSVPHLLTNGVLRLVHVAELLGVLQTDQQHDYVPGMGLRVASGKGGQLLQIPTQALQNIDLTLLSPVFSGSPSGSVPSSLMGGMVGSSGSQRGIVLGNSSTDVGGQRRQRSSRGGRSRGRSRMTLEQRLTMDKWSLVFYDDRIEHKFMLHMHTQAIKVLRFVDMVTTTAFWHKLAFAQPFFFWYSPEPEHRQFLILAGLGMAVTTCANLLPAKWYAPVREYAVGAGYMLTNVVVVPYTVCQVMAREDLPSEAFWAAAIFALWIYLCCPVYCCLRYATALRLLPLVWVASMQPLHYTMLAFNRLSAKLADGKTGSSRFNNSMNVPDASLVDKTPPVSHGLGLQGLSSSELEHAPLRLLPSAADLYSTWWAVSMVVVVVIPLLLVRMKEVRARNLFRQAMLTNPPRN